MTIGNLDCLSSQIKRNFEKNLNRQLFDDTRLKDVDPSGGLWSQMTYPNRHEDQIFVALYGVIYP